MSSQIEALLLKLEPLFTQVHSSAEMFQELTGQVFVELNNQNIESTYRTYKRMKVFWKEHLNVNFNTLISEMELQASIAGYKKEISSLEYLNDKITWLKILQIDYAIFCLDIKTFISENKF